MAASRMIARTVRPYLFAVTGGGEPADHAGDHGDLRGLRREALDVLAGGYRSPARTVLGLLSWLAVTGGGLLLAVAIAQRGQWPTLATGTALGAGAVGIGAGGWLGWSVRRAGRALTRAAAAWLGVPAPTTAGDDARRLRRVVRHRALLGAALTVAAATLAGAAIASAGVLPGLAAGTTAVAAVVVLGGVARLLDAAWQRPTAAPAEATAPPPAHWAPRAGSAPAPPTVEIAVRALGAPVAAGGERQVPDGEPAAPATRIEVVLPDGGLLPGGVTLVGRRPVRRAQDVDVTGYVVLTDGTVTKTHAALHLGAGELWVVDRASRNGTLVEDARGTLVRARPWRAVRVPVPATIHLGHARLRVRSVALPATPGRDPYEVAS